MSFKSKAQADKFKQLVKEKKITDERYNELFKATDFSKLPERLTKKPEKILGIEGLRQLFKTKFGKK